MGTISEDQNRCVFLNPPHSFSEATSEDEREALCPVREPDMTWCNLTDRFWVETLKNSTTKCRGFVFVCIQCLETAGIFVLHRRVLSCEPPPPPPSLRWVGPTSISKCHAQRTPLCSVLRFLRVFIFVCSVPFRELQRRFQFVQVVDKWCNVIEENVLPEALSTLCCEKPVIHSVRWCTGRPLWKDSLHGSLFSSGRYACSSCCFWTRFVCVCVCMCVCACVFVRVFACV